MKAHLIYSMVAVGMLFASCANEEPAPNMKADEGIQPVTRALSSATFRKSPIAMVYIEDPRRQWTARTVLQRERKRNYGKPRQVYPAASGQRHQSHDVDLRRPYGAGRSQYDECTG